MDRRLLEVRGRRFERASLPTSPADIERWHAEAIGQVADTSSPGLAARLRQISAELLVHAAQLADRETALAKRRARQR